jgi:RNA polymerase sigma-70 factor (ECF subfamily)
MYDLRGFDGLVREAQGGDRAAMDRILAILRPEIERLAGGYADPRRAVESTEDVVQEAWVKAWQKLDQFRGGADDGETAAMFRAWVEQIVHRVGLNAQRAWRAPTRRPRDAGMVRVAGASGRSGVEPPDDDPSPSARARTDEEARLVREAVERIEDATDRQIVVSRFFEGLSLREVARRIGLPYRTVRRRFEAAMEELERELGGAIEGAKE